MTATDKNIKENKNGGKKSRKGKKIDNGIGNIQHETNVYTMTMMREDKQIKSIKDKSMQDRRKKQAKLDNEDRTASQNK